MLNKHNGFWIFMAIEFRHAYRTVGAMISQCKMIIHTAYKPPPRQHEFTAKKGLWTKAWLCEYGFPSTSSNVVLSYYGYSAKKNTSCNDTQAEVIRDFLWKLWSRWTRDPWLFCCSKMKSNNQEYQTAVAECIIQKLPSFLLPPYQNINSYQVFFLGDSQISNVIFF